MTPNLITRQDIADLLGDSITARMVRKNEKSLGLDKARRDINPRTIRYRRDIAITILESRGLIPSTTHK